MNQKVYPKSLNLDSVAQRLEDVFGNDGFEVQKLGSADDLYLQLRKGGLARKVVGMDQALTVHMQRTGSSTSISMGQAAWMSKAADMTIGAFVLWPLMVTSAFGIYSQHKLPGRVWKSIDDYALSQGALGGRGVSEIGTQEVPAVPQGLHCPHCGVTNNADSSFCTACGSKLN